MLTLRFSQEICRRIVDRGTVPEFDNSIQYRKPQPSRHAISGHLVGTVTSATNSSITTVMVGQTIYNCSAPLLEAGTVLTAGLKVIIQKNILTGCWDVIAAECEES